jgi:hypothetical protein
MARSIAQQSADNQRQRREAAAAADRKAWEERGAAYATEEERQAARDAVTKPINYDAASAGAAPKTEAEKEAAAAERTRLEQEAQGKPAVVPRYTPPGAAGIAGQDPAGDSAAARALRQQLLDERKSVADGRMAPFVSEQAPIDAAQAGPAMQIAPNPIASTPDVKAGPVAAATIAPIERVTAARVATTPGAEAATIDKDPQEQFRQDQRSYVQALQDAAAGKAPSAAELMARRTAEDSRAAQLSMASAVHGRGAGSAMRQAGRTIAGIEQRGNLDAALIRAKEIETARGQLGAALGQGREQDIGLATKKAELGTTVSISNADRASAQAMKQADLEQAAAAGNAAAQNELARRQAELTTAANTRGAELKLEADKSNQAVEATKNLTAADMDLKSQIANADNDMKMQLANAGFSQQVILQMNSQDLQRQLANAGFRLTQTQVDDLRSKAATDAALTSQGQMLNFDTAQNQQETQKELQRMELQSKYEAAERANDTSTMNAILSMAATIGVGLITKISDRRAKTKIRKESTGDLDDFLSALESYNYEYKDKADGEGRRSGPMAQELERSLIGRSTVRTDEKGRKGVDTAALTLALAGAVARIRKEQRRSKGGR